MYMLYYTANDRFCDLQLALHAFYPSVSDFKDMSVDDRFCDLQLALHASYPSVSDFKDMSEITANMHSARSQAVLCTRNSLER